MLIAFLIRDEADWQNWRQAISQTKGKPVVHVADTEPRYHGTSAERAEAVAEVESFDDEEDRPDNEGDGELVELPKA